MLIANEEPVRGNVPAQKWPESRTVKQGLLCLRLHYPQQLDLTELDALSARPIADGHFQQGRNFRGQMPVQPSQNLIGRHSTRARAPDGLSRNLPARRHAVRDAGESQL